MSLKIGAKIATLRKAKGMTQEQLAAALGISPPAVSKWETDNSYPDITLLCPLARALGTNVDTLLAFEEELSGEQLVKDINEIAETARTEDIALAETALQNLLHQYPTSTALKYNAAATFILFEMFSPMSPAEKKAEWKAKRKTLLQDIYADRTSAYWQKAVCELASMALADDELDKAEGLLKELPQNSEDPTMLWALLYQKQNNNEKAQEMTQKRLYLLVHQVQTCLTLLMSEKMEPDVERALKICKIYQKVEELFGCGGVSDGLFLEIYQRSGQKQEALNSLCRVVDAYTSPVRLPEPLLFSKALTPKEGQAYPQALRQALLTGMLEDEVFAEFRGDARFQEAVEKLEKSLRL